MQEGIPAQIGRYKVLAEVGRGGFGRVYRAFDASVGRQVAIKVLTERAKDLLPRFRNEALVAGNLRHENIVTVYEYGQFEDQPFLAMEYLEGEDLQQIISSGKVLSLLDKCNIMSQVAEGLSCAHRNGVVHRDVKPANIMVLPDGRVKIMDFGIARLTDKDATRLTQEGYVIGTLLYMAPEQFTGRDVDALCDIFAYGVIYYELLTGKHPFRASDSRALMYSIAFEDPQPVRDLMPECPETLERVILRLLSKDRDLRYQTLKDVQFDTEILRIDLQRQRAAELLVQAQDEFANERLKEAQALVRQVLSLDPPNHAARALREELQKRLQRQALQPRVDAFLSAAEDHLAHRRFADALKSFEAALRLDSENAAIQARIEDARGLIEHSRAAAAHLSEARTELERQNLTAAFRAASEAVRQDPQNPDAAGLLARIEGAIENRRREQRIQEALHKAEDLVLLRAYDEAVGVLTGLGEPESPKVARMLEFLRKEKEAQERKQKLQTEMAAATGLLRERRTAEAVERLEQLRSGFPDEQEVAHLLSYARKELEAEARARAIQETEGTASALVESRKFDDALRLLDQALKKFPGETALIRLLGNAMAAKAAWEREAAIGSTVRDCGRLREQQRFAEAIEIVEATLRDHGTAPVLIELLQQLEQDWARKRRADAIRKAGSHASRLLDEKRFADAQEYLREAVMQFPGEAVLAGLLERAEDEIRRAERARALEAIASKASALAAARDYERALAAIDEGLESWGEDADLRRRRAEIAESKAQWERRVDIERASRDASALAARSEFDEALKVVASALSRYPDEPALPRLKSEIQEQWEQHKRREAIHAIAGEGRLLLSRGRLDEALQTIGDGLEQYAGDPDLEALSAQVQDAVRARDRDLAVKNIVRESQELAGASQFDRARDLLQQGLAAYPGEPRLQRELESVRAAAAERERRREVERILAEAEGLAANLRFDEALELLARGPAAPAEVQDCRTRIETERDRHRRREAIAKGASDAAALLDQGRPEEASRLLGDLASRYPGAAEWQPLLDRAREEIRALQRTRERRRAVEEAVRSSEELSRNGRFEEALDLLATSLRQYPDETALLELRGTIEAAWQQQERAKAISTASAEAQGLIDAGRLEQAVALLRDAPARYPEDAALGSLLARTERELESRQARRRAVEESSRLLAGEQYEQALQSIERALVRFAGDPELVALAAQARERLDARRREEAVAALAENALAVANAGDFERALLLVDRGLAGWPAEQRLIDLRDSIRSARAEWERESVRRETLRKLHQLARQERFAEAFQTAESALQTYPGDADLLRSRTDFHQRALLAEAGDLAGRGRPEDALQVLDRFSAEYGSTPEWKVLERRVRAEVAAHEKAAAAARQAQEARARAGGGDFDGALALLDDALRESPGEAALAEARRNVLAAQAAHLRRMAIRDIAAQCERLAQEGRLAEALERAARSVDEFPGEAELVALRSHLQAELEEEERRRQRGRDLEELRALDEGIACTADPVQLSAIADGARRLVAAYPADEEISGAAAAPLQHIADIETARGELSRRNFGAVLDLCGRYLSRYPGHAVLDGLRQQAESGLRAMWLDELRRRVEAEPDLAARIRLLEDAVARYPGETWTTAELQLTRSKLALVETIVAEARAQEAAGHLEAALDQWNKLAAVYDRFPDLALVIARLNAARERARAENVARRVRQIEEHISAGEFAKAGDLLRQSLAEEPGAAALLDLERHLEDLRRKQKQLRDLLSRMRAARLAGNWPEFDGCAPQALQLAAEGPLRRPALDSFVEHARALAESDWPRAEALVAQVRSVEPAYAFPEDLLRVVAERKRAAALEAAIERVRETAAAGDLRGAFAQVEAALREFPGDPRLDSAHSEISRRIEVQRVRVAAELRDLRGNCERATRPDELDGPRSRVAALARDFADDPQLAHLAAEVGRAIDARRKQLRRERLSGLLVSHRRSIAIAAASAALLIAAIAEIPRFFTATRPVAVRITAPMAGVTVTAGDQKCVTPNCTLRLRPGAYTLTAARNGFRTLNQALSISAGQPGVTIPVLLEELPQELQVNTNFPVGNVYLDDHLTGALRDGQYSLSGMAPGRHSIRVVGGGAEFQAQWSSSPGARPALSGPLSAKDVQAAVVANAGTSATVACNCGPSPVTIDGAPAGQTQSEAPFPLPQINEGPRRIGIGGRSLVVDIRPNPAINIFLALDRNVGTLVIQTGEDSARVYLNNHLNPRRTEHGMLRVPVAVGQYSIRVEKDGFRTSAAQTVSVAKGEDKEVAFSLAPLSPMLEITGAPPNAQVKVDGRPAGETGPDGAFRGDVPAGRHTVELTKEGYTPARTQARFMPGQAVRLRPSQLSMAKLPAPPPAVAPRKPPDPEEQDWARVAGAPTIQGLSDYLHTYPAGPHAPEARSLLEQLQQAEAARQEQLAWDKVDKNDKSALTAFLARYGSGSFASQARASLDAITNREAAAARAALPRPVQKQVEPPPPVQPTADVQAIERVLSDYEAAYNRMDVHALERLYKSLPGPVREQFRHFRTVAFQMKPTAPPVVSGDSAAVTCLRTQHVTTREGQRFSVDNERVSVTLVRTAAGWVIRDIARM